MDGPRLPSAGRRHDPLGLLPRDAGWVRRYVLAELFERPASARPPPRRGPRPLALRPPTPPGPAAPSGPGHSKL